MGAALPLGHHSLIFWSLTKHPAVYLCVATKTRQYSVLRRDMVRYIVSLELSYEEIQAKVE